MKAAILLAAVAMLSLSACRDDKVEKPEGNSLSISIDDGKGEGDAEVSVGGDTESGKLALKLPGGIEAKMTMPKGVIDNSDFDIEGVGLYPGAKVASVDVNARTGTNDAGAVVKVGFDAPGDAAAVADWYQQQFETKKVAVTRAGDTLTGKTEDGDDFTLAMTAGGAGTKGLLTIIDAKKG